jgi:aliphatic nitrilase
LGDSYAKLRLAAVQAAPVFLDRDASIEKACRLITEAGKEGADVVGFPEGFVPTHPGWFNYINGVGEQALCFSRELFKNAVEIPSSATDRLCEACRDANIVAVVGVNEKRPRTTSTMWNTQLFIDRTGEILGKHQKLVPTNGERLVHTGGHGGTLQAVQTHFGALSGLICGENSNPLAQFAVAVDYPVVHVASWPAHFSPTSDMQDSSILTARSLAYQLKAFVISSCAIVTDELINIYDPAPKDRAQLAEMKGVGGTCIAGPRGKLLAGPMGPGEGILYCDVDTQDVIIPKLIHDFAGHYNRPDIFSVAIAAEERRIFRHVSSDEPKTVGESLQEQPRRPVVDRRSPYYLEAPKVSARRGDQDA